MKLVGISYGGFVGYNMAIQLPEEVERLVLCCTGVCLEEKDLEKGLFPVAHSDEAASILLPQTPKKLRELMKFSFVHPIKGVPWFFLHDFINVVYLPGPDDTLVLDIAYRIYMKFGEYPNALQMALDLDNVKYLRRILTSCSDLLRKKQLCTILTRHRFAFKLDKKLVPDNATRESLQKIIGNNNLSEWYLYLARDLEVMEPKSPEDIYKAHLVDGENNDSDLQNFAATIVNAFINAGFGQQEFGELFETKEDRKISTIASLGIIFLWNVEASRSINVNQTGGIH